MWPNPQETAELVTFTEEILNGNLHILCSVIYLSRSVYSLINIHTLQSNFLPVREAVNGTDFQ